MAYLVRNFDDQKLAMKILALSSQLLACLNEQQRRESEES
jgi:hypothetical protein